MYTCTTDPPVLGDARIIADKNGIVCSWDTPDCAIKYSYNITVGGVTKVVDTTSNTFVNYNNTEQGEVYSCIVKAIDAELLILEQLQTVS